ncbi:MAG: hypothetical protein OCC45_08845 [Desulfotalea sp.]
MFTGYGSTGTTGGENDTLEAIAAYFIDKKSLVAAKKNIYGNHWFSNIKI